MNEYKQLVLPGFEEYVSYTPQSMRDVMIYFYKGYINWDTVEVYRDRLHPKANA